MGGKMEKDKWAILNSGEKKKEQKMKAKEHEVRRVLLGRVVPQWHNATHAREIVQATELENIEKERAAIVNCGNVEMLNDLEFRLAQFLEREGNMRWMLLEEMTIKPQNWITMD